MKKTTIIFFIRIHKHATYVHAYLNIHNCNMYVHYYECSIYMYMYMHVCTLLRNYVNYCDCSSIYVHVHTRLCWRDCALILCTYWTATFCYCRSGFSSIFKCMYTCACTCRYKSINNTGISRCVLFCPAMYICLHTCLWWLSAGGGPLPN